MTEPTPMPERAAHARHLIASERDAWVASATTDGDAYMIPLSYHWDGSAMLFSTPERSRTMRDLTRAGRTRVALPSARDVVILDGRVELVDPAGDPLAVDAFVARHDWDPRLEAQPYSFFRFVPDRIQAWRIASELPTRDVMRDGRWLDEVTASAS
jgi:hypothetical protein